MRMTSSLGVAVLIGSLASAGASAQSLPTPPPVSDTPTRGRLLYETHCVVCHTTQMHWRDQRLATDWDSLVALVRHWQQQAQLRWSEADIVAVARHLNETIYRYPPPARRASRPSEPRRPDGVG